MSENTFEELYEELESALRKPMIEEETEFIAAELRKSLVDNFGVEATEEVMLVLARERAKILETIKGVTVVEITPDALTHHFDPNDYSYVIRAATLDDFSHLKLQVEWEEVQVLGKLEEEKPHVSVSRRGSGTCDFKTLSTAWEDGMDPLMGPYRERRVEVRSQRCSRCGVEISGTARERVRGNTTMYFCVTCPPQIVRGTRKR